MRDHLHRRLAVRTAVGLLIQVAPPAWAARTAAVGGTVAALSASASIPTTTPVSEAAASLADTTRSRRGWPRKVVTEVRCRNSPANSAIQASRPHRRH
jgi:hypothetical protein